jgi:hypothetical protein
MRAAHTFSRVSISSTVNRRSCARARCPREAPGILLLLVTAPAIAADARTATLDVSSMFCALCRMSVRKALERLPGVIKAKADNNSKRLCG